jgi:hypothetical protein
MLAIPCRSGFILPAFPRKNGAVAEDGGVRSAYGL